MISTFLAMPADEQRLLTAGTLCVAAGLGLLVWLTCRRRR